MATKKQTTIAKPLSVADKLAAIGVDAICDRVANCEFLQTIADDCSVSRGSLVKWLSNDENVSLYARAREAQADKMAEDILAIADDGKNDTYLDEDGNPRTDQDVIARSRLRVDARKWLASKMAPKKYGDKLETTHAGKITMVREMTDAELAAIASSSGE